MNKLNPDALAVCGDIKLDQRPEVQFTTVAMILTHVLDHSGLPFESANPFSNWIYDTWYDFNEDGTLTNGQVIEGAITHWCGGRTL